MRKYMKKKAVIMCLAAAMLMNLTACGTKQGSKDIPQSQSGSSSTELSGDTEQKEMEIDENIMNNTGKISNFSIELFKRSITDGENAVISPVSVIYALGMAANGADGNTLAEIEQTLGVSADELNQYLNQYLQILKTDEKTKVNIANSIWFKDTPDFEPAQEFLLKNKEYYNASTYKSAFDDLTLNDINSWVSENTDGMIKNILNRISQDAVMYIINAVSFDAKWASVYTEFNVSDGIFTKEDGEETEAEFMNSTEHTYIEDENSKGFVKYYSGGNYAFAAILPDEDISVYDYVSELTGDKLNNMLENAVTGATVHTALPKFKTEGSYEMSEILADMGIIEAFDPDSADFAGIGTSSEGNIFINRVIHKSFIEVDLEGTKAGAATVIEMNSATALPTDIKEVRLDRPFVYIIFDCETNLPLFIGTMMDVSK